MEPASFRGRMWAVQRNLHDRILAYPFLTGLVTARYRGTRSCTTSSADVLAVVDRVGETSSAAEEATMREYVLTTARYEWMSWDAAWRRETWP